MKIKLNIVTLLSLLLMPLQIFGNQDKSPEFIVALKNKPSVNNNLRYKINDLCSSIHNEIHYCIINSLDHPLIDQEQNNIEFIEPNSIYRINYQKYQKQKYNNDEKKEQPNAPWGISRISYESKPLFNQTSYRYYENDGENSMVYVIDTGCFIEHENFEGRVEHGANFVTDEDDMDYNGHGTHVFGTILSKTYGIAKKAKGIAVKVLNGDGSGSLSGVVKGVDFVISEHLKNPQQKSIINMSLGGGKSLMLDKVVKLASEAGIYVVVAAGNENEDACNGSPSGSPFAITVGATSLNDKRAYFSNYGKCVDIYAPGTSIISTTNKQNQVVALSGTSMASPHVAGVVAALLSRPNIKFNTQYLLDLSIKNIVPKEVQGFLFNGYEENHYKHLIIQE